jgi:hypothetical protein
MFEQEWQTYHLRMPLLSLTACMFLLVSSLGGMHGIEVVWTNLAALQYNIAFCEAAEDDTAVSWPIVGRFKAWHGILDCYMIPIAGVMIRPVTRSMTASEPHDIVAARSNTPPK